jgi:23S rRNA pseudouridine1911/1915/1917 synthase
MTSLCNDKTETTVNEKWLTAVAEPKDVGIRVDKWLATWTKLSRARIGALIGDKQVRANGDIINKPTNKVRENVEYAVLVPPPIDDTPKPENIYLDILFEDEQLIVVNKSAGMTVHPAPGSRSATLVNALLHHCADSLSGIGGVLRPGIVHRLDKDTSGVLVVAKTDRAHRYLSKQFAKHTVERHYICLVRSAPKPREGKIVTRIARSPNDRKKQSVVRGTSNNVESSEHGRHAITNYKYCKGYGQQPNAAVGIPQVSMVECRLETGRTHQIRVHLAHIGCPLLGDPLYGKQRAFLTSKDPNEAIVKIAIENLKRQALHAASLGFKHPITKEFMLFESPIPNDMAELITSLEKLNKQ